MKKSAKPSAHTEYHAKYLLATPSGVEVHPGQLLLLRGLAVSICLVWGKAEPTIRPFRTILHYALNEQTASSDRSCLCGYLPVI